MTIMAPEVSPDIFCQCVDHVFSYKSNISIMDVDANAVWTRVASFKIRIKVRKLIVKEREETTRAFVSLFLLTCRRTGKPHFFYIDMSRFIPKKNHGAP